MQQHVSYEFLWIRRTCDYIKLNVHCCVLFSSRFRIRISVRIRFIVCLVTCYAHVFVLVSIVVVALPVLYVRFVLLYISTRWEELVGAYAWVKCRLFIDYGDELSSEYSAHHCFCLRSKAK